MTAAIKESIVIFSNATLKKTLRVQLIKQSAPKFSQHLQQTNKFVRAFVLCFPFEKIFLVETVVMYNESFLFGEWSLYRRVYGQSS